MSHAKTAEPIEMPYRLRTRVGPENHVLDGGPDLTWEGTILRGRRGFPLCSIGTLYDEYVAKTAEPTEMPLRFWASIGPRNHVYMGSRLQISGGNEQLKGEGRPVVKYSDILS